MVECKSLHNYHLLASIKFQTPDPIRYFTWSTITEQKTSGIIAIKLLLEPLLQQVLIWKLWIIIKQTKATHLIITWLCLIMLWTRSMSTCKYLELATKNQSNIRNKKTKKTTHLLTSPSSSIFYNLDRHRLLYKNILIL